MKIIFLKTGNLITNWLRFLTHIPRFNDCLYNSTQWGTKWNSKISVFQLFIELGETWKHSLS